MAKAEQERGGSPGKSATTKILSRLSSLKITVAVLLLLSGVFVVATVIPQHQAFPFSQGIDARDRVARLMSVSDIFHSMWLFVPTLILSVNLFCCMIVWSRAALRTRAEVRTPGQCSFEKNLPAGTDGAGLKKEIQAVLGRGWHLTGTEETTDSWRLAAEKSRVRAYAPLALHASIIMIILGAVLGLFGFKGTMEIREGGVQDMLRVDDGSAMKLPFSVRCDDFLVEYYDNGMPREYLSGVTFVETGYMAEKASIRVNHPAYFGGIMFSQSAFHEFLTARIAVRDDQGVQHALAGEGDVFLLHGGRYRIHVRSIKEDVMHLGPAAELVMETPGESRSLWIFRDRHLFEARFPGFLESHPEFNPSSLSPYTFTLEKIDKEYATVFSVNRDPGIVPVAIGAILFITGILVVFLVQKVRIVISLESTADGGLLRMHQTLNGRKCEVDRAVLEGLEHLLGGKK